MNEHNPLWAYERLAPGRREVEAQRVPAPAGGDTLVLSSTDPLALLAVAADTFGERAPFALPPLRAPGPAPCPPADVSLRGVPGEAVERPPVATVPRPADRAGALLLVRADRCDGCLECVPACPVGCIRADAPVVAIDESRCIECWACAEACPRDALAPVAGAPVLTPDVSRPAGFLAALASAPRSRTSDAAAPVAAPAPARRAGRPFYVLGLAVATMQENGAALLRDGRLVGAVEEERFSRLKHQGFRVPGRPGRTLCNDLSLRPEDAVAWRSVRHLLRQENISFEDVDVVAVNGIPARLRRSYNPDGAAPAPAVLRTGRHVWVPHHLAHAASAYYFGGRRDSFVLTVDGRGDRETAAFFAGRDGRLERVFDVLSTDDSSIGGVYETVTRLLGFGGHGQGSTMALAVMGEPTYDLGAALSLERHDRHSIHERAVDAFAHLRRARHEPIRAEHRNLAASVQRALEETVIALVEEGRAGARVDSLCLAGGVALNCQMNSRLRKHFGVGHMFVQPAANDAGTAIGAALEAHRFVTGEAPFQPFASAHLGPAYDDAAVDEALAVFGLESERMDDPAARVAQLVADRAVVAWFQGRLEIGPRALGGRSLLANPADASVAARLNDAKGREPWRPFAPSILAGREGEWFADDAGNPFMLFVSSVRQERRPQVPAIVHADGTTRPQSVTRDAAPLYHRMLEEFERRTGIPFVLNTSFNTADEPIVCSPRDAVSSFLQLGADWLAIGDRLVRHPKDRRHAPAARPVPPPRPAPAPAAAPRRLLVRLGARCNSACVHCTVRDLAGQAERDTAQVLAELAEGRRRGCTEAVLLRGEPLIRKDIVRLVHEARAMGYSHVQVQTNGRMLALPDVVPTLLRRGVTFFEVSLYGDEPAVHDGISRAPGSFQQTVAGLQALVRAGAPFMVGVPVQTANCLRLRLMVERLHGLGVGRVQFSLARPVWLPEAGRFDPAPVARLARAAPRIAEALRAAFDRGMAASVEGVPLCHLDPDLWDAAEWPGAVDDQLISDLARTDSAVAIRAESRAAPAACARCRVAARCAKPGSAFVHLWGDGELSPVA